MKDLEVASLLDQTSFSDEESPNVDTDELQKEEEKKDAACLPVALFMFLMLVALAAATRLEKDAMQPKNVPNQTYPDSLLENSNSLSEDDFTIHVVFEDLHYRRVCAPVHSSHLCLTIRYPFPVEEQDPSSPYAKPVQTKFYDNDVSVKFIDGDELSFCQNLTDGAIGSPDVKACIDYHHEEMGDQIPVATALWTRFREGELSFYGIESKGQHDRVQSFFNKNILLVLGASPSPPIASSLQSLFQKCLSIDHWNGMAHGEKIDGFKSPGRGQHACFSTEANDGFESVLGNWDDLKEQDEWSLILIDGFYPNDLGHAFYNHSITPGTTVVSELQKIQAFSNWTNVKFTVIIEHPIAHIQNEELMIQSYDYIASLQNEWTQVFLNATRDDQKEWLGSQGIEISNLIAFDGSPQFFPTESGGYSGHFLQFRTEEDFKELGGYEGWNAEYGSRCRGFLPSTSNLTQFNNLGRTQYESNGQDMRFYGRTWEFINLVWFTVKGTSGWGMKGLDCTHGGQNSAIHLMHRYFIMAMVDDHYDNQIRSQNHKI